MTGRFQTRARDAIYEFEAVIAELDRQAEDPRERYLAERLIELVAEFRRDLKRAEEDQGNPSVERKVALRVADF